MGDVKGKREWELQEGASSFCYLPSTVIASIFLCEIEPANPFLPIQMPSVSSPFFGALAIYSNSQLPKR